VTVAVNRVLQRDFAAEWNDSLRVKIFEPLGENELKRITKKRRR
jgi:putative membrane protein